MREPLALPCPWPCPGGPPGCSTSRAAGCSEDFVAFAPPLASPRGVSSHLPPPTGNTGQPGSRLCPSPCRASKTRIFHSPALQRPEMSRPRLKPSRADPRRAEAFVGRAGAIGRVCSLHLGCPGPKVKLRKGRKEGRGAYLPLGNVRSQPREDVLLKCCYTSKVVLGWSRASREWLLDPVTSGRFLQPCEKDGERVCETRAVKTRGD